MHFAQLNSDFSLDRLVKANSPTIEQLSSYYNGLKQEVAKGVELVQLFKEFSHFENYVERATGTIIEQSLPVLSALTKSNYLSEENAVKREALARLWRTN